MNKPTVTLPKPSPERFVVTLTDASVGSPVAPHKRLARCLKMLLRTYGMRCTSVMAADPTHVAEVKQSVRIDAERRTDTASVVGKGAWSLMHNSADGLAEAHADALARLGSYGPAGWAPALSLFAAVVAPCRFPGYLTNARLVAMAQRIIDRAADGTWAQQQADELERVREWVTLAGEAQREGGSDAE